MFKKLKDKIAEEVKISPQRMQQIQQFTQSMSDKLQPGSGNPDDGLFSISEDDARTVDSGFTNVPLYASTPTLELPQRIRRNSNSSIASDVSFLPRYESSVNSYHLQSDLDISASELEDNVSQVSSQLGHVSKEQVHTAFQKAQMRYHKYRGRYTDLANHYKELERENAKMKAVLVETQDKAIRRVSELKEQCTLSQKAKADLEAALRTEIEEKIIVIDSLKQKVDLLQTSSSADLSNGSDSGSPITNGNNNEDLLAELNEKLQEHKANSIISKERLGILQRELDEAKKMIAVCEERDKSNNLKFAKSKLDLHTELQNRELEITNLKQDLDTLRHDLEGYEKGGGLKAQNSNLIEKCESLKTKCREYESELLKVEQYKIEISDLQQKVRHLESAQGDYNEIKARNEELLEEVAKFATLRASHMEEIKKLQEQTKQSLVSLQEKMKTSLELEYNAKELKLKNEFETKLEQLHEDGDSLKQTQVKLLQAEEQVNKYETLLKEHSQNLKILNEKNTHLEKNYIILMEENNGRGYEINVLNNQLKDVETSAESNHRARIALQDDKSRLESELAGAQSEIHRVKQLEAQYNAERDSLLMELQETRDKLKQESQSRELVQRNLAEDNEKALQTEKAYSELEESKKVLEQTIMALEQQMTELTHALKQETLAKNKHAEEKDQLLKRINESEKVLKLHELLKTDYDQIQREYVEMKNKLINVNGEYHKLQQQVVELSSKNTQINLNLQGANDINKQLNLQLAEVQAKDEELKEKEKELVLQVSTLEQQLKTRTTKFDLLQQNHQELVKEYKEVKLKLEATDIVNDNLRQENNTLRTLHDKLSSEKDHLCSQINILKEESLMITENLKNLQDLQKDNLIMQELNAKLKEELSEKEEFKEQMKIEKDQFQQKCLLLEENLLANTFDEERSKLLSQISQASQNYDEILHKCKQQELQIQDMERQHAAINHLSTENESLIKQITLEKEEIEDKLKTYKEAWHKERDALLQQLKQLQHDFDKSPNLQQQLTKLEQNENLIKSQLDTTTKEYNSLKLAESTWQEERNRLLNQLQQLSIAHDKTLGKCKTLESSMRTTSELENQILNLQEEINTLKQRNEQIFADNKRLMEENDSLLGESSEVKLQLATKITNTDAEVATKLADVTAKYTEAVEEAKLAQEALQKLQEEMSNLDSSRSQHAKILVDLEAHIAELVQERQLLHDEIAELKTAPLNEMAATSSLQAQLAQYKSIDATNRASIEFYEKELAKMRTKHEKLNRRLDETLVTLNHCADLSASTEVEYLKNVLYNYMLGKESLVLARVIAAVCKFDRQQTEAVLKHEQDKQSLLGQLGIL